MQYWINQNGVQSGPLSREDLEKMAVSSDAYVWRSGLEDWVKITTLPELEGVIGVGATPDAVTETPVETEQIQEVQSSIDEPVQTQEPVQETATQEPTIPEQPVVVAGVPVASPVAQGVPQYAQQCAPQQPQQLSQEPCPPTNMVWAIITTLLCCTPLGIVAIFYAVKVKNKYAMGDIAGAKKASETGAWWCIASIILSIICSPFISLIQMATSM